MLAKTQLRKEIPRVLQKLVDAGTLIKLDEEYSLQTRESSEWDREFRNRQTKLNSDPTALASKRGTLISAACGATHKGMTLSQGQLDQAKISLTDFRAETPTINANRLQEIG
jgi:hypothetical protein